MFKVFVRTWWRDNPNWPNGLEPCVGPSRTIRRHVADESTALAMAQQWNATHKPGRLSRKAEYSRERG